MDTLSPSLAVDSRVFTTYLWILTAALAAAGAVLALSTFGLGRDVRKVWAIYRSWLVMLPLFAGALFAGRVPFILFITFLAAAGFKEFARATGLYRDWWMTGAVYLGIAAVSATAIISPPGEPATVGWYGMFTALPVYVIALLLMIPIARNRSTGQLQTVALSILGFVYIGWMFQHVALLANSPRAYGYLLYIVLAVQANDIAAFTCGKLFGRRKLRSNISPNKTWGGSLGALAISMLLPWALGFSFPHFGATELLLAGVIVGVGGQLGDLSISFIKRDLGIKDMGATIPGHGGILDRIDSLIYTAPLFFHMVHYFHGLT